MEITQSSVMVFETSYRSLEIKDSSKGEAVYVGGRVLGYIRNGDK